MGWGTLGEVRDGSEDPWGVQGRVWWYYRRSDRSGDPTEGPGRLGDSRIGQGGV